MSINTTVAEAFAGRDYSGASLALAVGHYNTELLTRSLGKGSIYSLKVAPGYSVTLYTEIGAFETLTVDTPYFSDYFNGKIYSASVFTTPASSESWEQVVFVQPPPAY